MRHLNRRITRWYHARTRGMFLQGASRWCSMTAGDKHRRTNNEQRGLKRMQDGGDSDDELLDRSPPH